MANAFTFSTKRKEITGLNQQQHDEAILLPGLPDQIARLCLSFINPSLLYSVCHSWRRLIYSPSFPPFFSLYALLHYSQSSNSIEFFNFDPISSTWHLLPSPPPLHHVLLHHPSFISRNFPIQSVSHNLILLAATTHNFAPALSHSSTHSPKHGPSDPNSPHRAAGAQHGIRG
ncbi:hypothetical protein SO802_034652 [Lithocarpus litseifolius]|uniref:F-box domain-containing protein n=1 Tax=Lithocarpus litseifolius TaxID=425828 RepID=A0AAW2BIU3_9ROSI